MGRVETRAKKFRSGPGGGGWHACAKVTVRKKVRKTTDPSIHQQTLLRRGEDRWGGSKRAQRKREGANTPALRIQTVKTNHEDGRRVHNAVHSVQQAR